MLWRQRQHRLYATLSGTLASLTQQFSCFRHGGRASLRTLIRHGVNCAGCGERRSSESGHAHGNRAKSLALLARVPDLRYSAPSRIGPFFTDRESRIARYSTCKMRACGLLEVFLRQQIYYWAGVLCTGRQLADARLVCSVYSPFSVLGLCAVMGNEDQKRLRALIARASRVAPQDFFYDFRPSSRSTQRSSGAKPSFLERTSVTPRTEDRGPIKSACSVSRTTGAVGIVFLNTFAASRPFIWGMARSMSTNRALVPAPV